MDFATAVREARTSSGLTQADLASRAKVSQHAIWELENRHNGTVAVLAAACAALDLRFTVYPEVETSEIR
jgi:transcriptional regulator with XRE-family HTH domain